MLPLLLFPVRWSRPPSMIALTQVFPSRSYLVQDSARLVPKVENVRNLSFAGLELVESALSDRIALASQVRRTISWPVLQLCLIVIPHCFKVQSASSRKAEHLAYSYTHLQRMLDLDLVGLFQLEMSLISMSQIFLHTWLSIPQQLQSVDI